MQRMNAPLTHKILVVDDDQRLRDLLRRYLTEQGFNVFLAENATSMNKLWTRERFDLLVLDLMLPGPSGLDVLKRFRDRSDAPALILSARNDSETRVRGLKLGADDYLTKPFWPEELIERVRARLRRPTLQRGSAVVSGPVRIDLHSREVSSGGALVGLTATEYAVLTAIARRRGAPVTRQSLLELLEGVKDGANGALDVHVSRLRKKLGDGGGQIVTVWGIGYRLRDAS